ncbi:hypothetical protein Pla108_08020 [Botrimarina colliarenosi]|uniref:Endo-beta-1,6-galactanase-like domain-containing protein n=1 Tax=Botrimarina colliarenosi TaxID=2528001 RepID=A0A5C6AJP9_9BACT|nr:glycoside hydrolase [Botrimarina colliarenosi]TWT99859.1 hypothetical protein Pla108_08020 [Botrimarina colliarenosi]
MKSLPILMLVLIAFQSTRAEVALTIDVDSPEAYAFEGWGTSLCWWAHRVGGWRDESLGPLLDAITDPVDGLGLSVFRYNIGGGEAPDHNHFRRYADLPGFQAGPDAPLDPNADERQRRVLEMLVSRVPDAVLEAFSNSPPYWMTRSGCAAGGVLGQPNLADDRVDDFAAYLTNVLAAYRDRHGLVFRSLDPFNEPNQPWWNTSGNQEGCHVPEGQQSAVLLAVSQALAERGLDKTTTLAATDAHSIDLALHNAQRLTPAALATVGQINTHTYRGSQRRELSDFAATEGKRLWQSESGPMGLRKRGGGVLLAMMRRVALDLNELRPTAWVMWQVVDVSSQWSCFHLDDPTETFRPNSNYGLYSQFTRRIRPGDRIVPTADAAVVAAVSSNDQRLMVVVVNDDDAPRPCRVGVRGATPVIGTAEGSSSSVDEARTVVAVEQDESLRFTAPPESVTSVVVELDR